MNTFQATMIYTFLIKEFDDEKFSHILKYLFKI